MEPIEYSNDATPKHECKDCKECKNGNDCKDCNDCNDNKKQPNDKWKYTLYTVIIAILVFNPYTYIIVNDLLNRFVKVAISNKLGCPTTLGFVVHMAVFTLVLRYIMDLNI